MRTCLVEGCGFHVELAAWPLCTPHHAAWVESPESDRCVGFQDEPGAGSRTIEDEQPRWDVALVDWVQRIAAERRNGGQT